MSAYLLLRVFSGCSRFLWFICAGLMDGFGSILAVDSLSVPFFSFYQVAQAPSGLWVTLGVCCGVWGQTLVCLSL